MGRLFAPSSQRTCARCTIHSSSSRSSAAARPTLNAPMYSASRSSYPRHQPILSLYAPCEEARYSQEQVARGSLSCIASRGTLIRPSWRARRPRAGRCLRPRCPPHRCCAATIWWAGAPSMPRERRAAPRHLPWTSLLGVAERRTRSRGRPGRSVLAQTGAVPSGAILC